MNNKDLSKKVLASLLTMSCVYLGGTSALPMAEAAENDPNNTVGQVITVGGSLTGGDIFNFTSENTANSTALRFYGENLDGLMNARANALCGIVNGIDYEVYNPKTDTSLAANYDQITFRKEKWKNKVALQKELGLTQDKGKFMIGIVSRLTDQKGLDLIAYVMDELCADDIQLVVLGTGDEKYENMFRHYDWKYNDRVSANIYYSEEMSHKIYAACDAFLMPSLFEPCGLRDTVEAYNEFDKTGTGFSFTNYNAHEMLNTVRYAERIYYDRKRDWNKIVERAMSKDFSWKNSAGQYQELYKSLIGE